MNVKMRDPNIKENRAVFIFTFISGCLGLIFVTVLDKLYWDTDILAEGYPDFSQDHLMRSLVICVSVAAILWSLIGKQKPTLMLVDNHKFPIEMLWIGGVLAVNVVLISLFIVNPEFFSMLSLEDGPIEWGSALLSFSSCIMFIMIFLKCFNKLNVPKVTKASLAILALAFFVIAMEEISWGQRLFDFETTKIFDGNDQNETNFHNIATDYFENIFYMGTFLFFVLMSFIYWLYPSLSNNKYLRLFIARPYVAVIATISAAYNFDMWNVSLIQISFFGSLLILLSFVVLSNNRYERYLIVFTMILVVVTQGLFLIKGEKVFMRLPEITEYKEFFIPLVFFVYSLDVSTYINRVYSSAKINTTSCQTK